MTGAAKRIRFAGMKAAALPAFALLMLATPALADPCKAIPDSGKAPAHLKAGRTISGPVTYVGDGDSLCVGLGRRPAEWVEIRLADFRAPELSEKGRGPAAKKALERVAMGRRVTCRLKNRTYDRMAAWCTRDGVTLSTLLRREGVPEGGR